MIKPRLTILLVASVNLVFTRDLRSKKKVVTVGHAASKTWRSHVLPDISAAK